MKNYLSIFAALLLCGISIGAKAQTVATNPLQANPKANCVVPFKYNDAGTKLPDIEWGLDQAWLWDDIVNRSVSISGKGIYGTARLSFRVNAPLVNGTDLTDDMKSYLDQRIANIDRIDPNIPLAINTDQEEGIDDWYHGTYNSNWSISGTTYSIKTYLDPSRWVANIKAHIQYIENHSNHRVISISPFNEPDYGWCQGTLSDPDTKNKNNTAETQYEMKSICDALKADPFFNGRRICGGNTLNDDNAMSWYTYLGSSIDEGNTHQLAGTMANYKAFFEKVKTDGKHATADELHNIMEAFIGSECGMQTGIWWGHAERARADLMHATRGVRLGYAEDADHWMGACVYRNLDGVTQAFIGQSERQAVTSSFAFRTNAPVFFEGEGPLREFRADVNGGEAGSYSNGQHNGERVYEVHGGADVPTHINGNYYLVSRSAGHKCITAQNQNGWDLTLAAATANNGLQQWSFTPWTDNETYLDEKDNQIKPTQGDYSYFKVKNVSSQRAIDIINWSLTEGDKFIEYQWGGGANQTYWIEYADDGYFYIRCRQSGMCLTASGNGVVQMPKQKGNANQHWRFIPASVTPEFVAPAQPCELTAKAQGGSIRLDWRAGAEGDATLDGYTILRGTEENSGYCTIARGVTATAFVDHDIVAGETYYYRVKAVDKSLNSSKLTDAVNAQTKDGEHLVAHWTFDNKLTDETENMNNAVTLNNASYVSGKSGNALSFDGSAQFAQLPYDIAKMRTMTFAAWVKWDGGSDWQRIFDFGNNQDEYVFLSPSNGSNMAFEIKANGTTKTITATKLPANAWKHVAVTVGGGTVRIYVDGAEVASESCALTPADVAANFNYLGRSQFNADPLFKGAMDDVRLYNFALSADEVATLAAGRNVSEQTITLNISKAEWATLTLPFEAVVPEGLKAYSCAGWNAIDESTYALKLSESATFEAYTPYLVYGDYTVADENDGALAPPRRVGVQRESFAFTGKVAERAETTFQPSGSLFVGTTAAMTVPAGSYVLQNQKNNGVGFYLVPEGQTANIGAYRCYLVAPAGVPSAVKAFRLVVDDDADAISGVQQSAAGSRQSVYTLSGTRLNSVKNLKSGVYIINNKKVIITTN